MFALNNQQTSITHFLPRMEKHGPDNVLAGTLKCETTMHNSVLDLFDKGFKKLLYRKPAPGEPTDAMLKAGTDVPLYGQFYPGHTADESEYVNEQYHAAARRGQIYAAMLAAAPSPGEWA